MPLIDKQPAPTNIEPINATTFRVRVGVEDIEIGDVKSATFKPCLKLPRWGECSIELVPDLAMVMSPTIVSKALVAEDSERKFEWNPAPVNKDFNEFGGIDWKITLKKKPLSNLFPFKYDAINTVAYHQASLKEKFSVGPQLDMPDIVSVSDTEVLGNGGLVLVGRPEHVVNSIVFYHSTKGGRVTKEEVAKGLTTGQIGFLYRMKVRDSVGKTAWFDWLPPETGVITGKIDQKFLDTAIYPVFVEPVGDTFGYTTVGGTNGPLEGYIRSSGTAYTGGVGVADSMSIYAYRTFETGLIDLGLYRQSDSVLMGVTSEVIITDDTPQWRIENFLSPPTIAAVDYRPSFNSQTSYVRLYYNDLNVKRLYVTHTYGTAWPNPITWVESATEMTFSIYCTYTPAGAGWANKFNGVANAAIAKINGVAKAAIVKVNGVA